MKKFVLISLVLILAACSNNGGSSSSADPIYGEWFYENPSSTSTSGRGVIGKIEENGNIQIMNIYAQGNSNSVTAVVRKSIGTFTRSGDQLHIAWSYETCNPVKNEIVYIKIAPNGQLQVKNADGSIQFNMTKGSGATSVKSIAIVEDKNCNILSKIQSENKRIPASTKTTLDLLVL